MRILFILILLSSKLAATELVVWHAFEGFIADQFQEIVDGFNGATVSLQNKGNYRETYESGLKAWDQGSPPHLLLVYEVASHDILKRPEVFVPVDTLLPMVLTDDFLEVIRGFYSRKDGRLCSLPFNCSTGVLYYNKTAFQNAGLEDIAPATWPEMEAVGRKLHEAGYYGFTTCWPVAYHLEHLCGWHSLPFATHGNGLRGDNAKLCFNNADQVRHLAHLVSWKREGVFTYSGRFLDGEKRFLAGECAMLMQGANRYTLLQKQANFEIGVGAVPYWPDIPGAPFNLSIGGASLFAMSGFESETYAEITRFLAYLSSPEVQAKWHERTGYLPVTKKALKIAQDHGFHDRHPAAKIAVWEVMRGIPTDYTLGIRLPNYPKVRDRINDFLEAAFDEKILPEKALDLAETKGNQILEQS